MLRKPLREKIFIRINRDAMLISLFFNILKAGLNTIFFIVFIAIFILVCVNIYLSFLGKNKKMPLPVMLIAALNISFGAQSLAAIFLIQPTDSFEYLFLAKFFMFLFGIFNMYIGIGLLKFNNYARLAVLWVLVIFGVVDVIVTITTEHSKYVLAFMGFYGVLFTVYYFSLNYKYFKKEGGDFSLKDNVDIKKKPDSLYDYFKEDRK